MRCKREQSSYQQLEAEVARQRILARKQKLLAQREADTAEIDRLSAQRTLERYEGVANEGIIAKIDFQKAKDALKSAADPRQARGQTPPCWKATTSALALKTKVNELRAPAPVDGQRPAPRRRTDRARAGRRLHRHAVGRRTAAWSPANTALMTLVDLSRLEVELEVPETYVADMGLGMTAEIDHRRPAPRPASCRRCRRKWCATRCWRACASTASSRPACARASA